MQLGYERGSGHGALGAGGERSRFSGGVSGPKYATIIK